MCSGTVISSTPAFAQIKPCGVNESNARKQQLILLPKDADASAQLLRTRLRELVMQETDLDMAVIISDTWGRPWRNGQVNMAIGVAGMDAFIDYRGQYDPYGHELQASVIAVAD